MKYFGLWCNPEKGPTFFVRSALKGQYQSARTSFKFLNRPSSVDNYDPNDHRCNRFIGPEVLIEWGEDETSTS